MSVKNRVTVNLEEDEYRALQKIANETDRSLAWLGRRAICDFIQREEKQRSTSSPNRLESTAAERQGAR